MRWGYLGEIIGGAAGALICIVIVKEILPLLMIGLTGRFVLSAFVTKR
ncbi:MAG: hypothetical protein ACO1QB_00225 [Verrucomicrobiales bacterium]